MSFPAVSPTLVECTDAGGDRRWPGSVNLAHSEIQADWERLENTAEGSCVISTSSTSRPRAQESHQGGVEAIVGPHCPQLTASLIAVFLHQFVPVRSRVQAIGEAASPDVG